MSANPLLDANNIVGFVTFVTLVGGLIVSVVKWVNGKVEKVEALVSHKTNNQVMRIDALERRDDDKEVRLALAERGLELNTKWQERFEDKFDKRFDQIEASIRESRPRTGS